MMPYTAHKVILALLLSVFVASCVPGPQPIEHEPVLPELTFAQAQTVFHLNTSALDYRVFETDATSVSIDIHNTLPEELYAFGDISIEDGSGIATYEVQPGESTIIHSMPQGEKRLTISSGGQTKLNYQLTGVFIRRITFNASAIPVKPANKTMVIYGDSITVGGKVDHPSAEAWPVLLRKEYSVIVEAYGYRTLYEDASDSVKRSELATKISTWKPDYVWLAIGANDYAFDQWSAQDFGTAYASLLDSIHLFSPHALLFAQSPIARANEKTNASGDDLESYRQQIASACLARPAWCVFVDAKKSAFPQPNELDKDGIHLTTTSSVKYAEAVLTVLHGLDK